MARYLHHADLKIQRYIDAKKKLIGLLEEKKQAVIQQAVTGKIDVRTGKPYSAYKDSGVEWLGEVPEHWCVRRLKYLASNVAEYATEAFEQGPLVALEDVQSWTGRVAMPDEFNRFDGQLKRFRADDVLFGKLRPYLAKVARLSLAGHCVGEFLVLRPTSESVDPLFLELYLRSKSVIDAINGSTFGARMPRADWTFIGGMQVGRPPPSEQTEIVKFLKRTSESVDKSIAAARRQIKLVSEYRARLIADVVTGKLDVRRAAERLPDIDQLTNNGEAAEEPLDVARLSE